MEVLADRLAGLSPDKRALLEALLQKKRAAAADAAAIRPRSAGAGPWPLSFPQERLWLIDQLDPGSPAYDMPLALRLTGELSPGLLARVFAGIVRRHEALRTTFAVQGGHPVQVIAGVLPPELPLVDLSCLGAAERDGQALGLAREEAARPFDLQRGPLLRLCLVRLAAREHLLLVTLHHIVSDGWSLGVLQREVGTLYAAFSAGLPSPLPELPVQYADFAVWQRSRMSGEALAGPLGWWREELAGAPGELALPTDRSRGPLQSREGTSLPMTLPRGLAEAVRELAQREGVTPFMLLLAAFQMLLHRLSGQEDVLVGTPVANRQRIETEGLIGFFVNTLVLRGRLASQGLTFRGLLEATRETVLAAFERQDLPFERLVEELVPERNLAVAPLFQVFFSLQTASPARVSLPGLTLEALAVHSGVAQFDLSLDLLDTGGELRASLEISRALFDAATGRRILESFAHLLRGAVDAPERPVAELPLLDAAQRHQILREWNDTGALPDGCASILPLFERQAALAPDAPALSQGDRRLTYGELDRRAVRLARRLRRLGVGPETRVAVVAKRAPELIVAFLGILKAGGAYVPIDPAYPRERREFMLADSGAVLLEEEKDDTDDTDEGTDGDTDGHVPAAEQLAYVLYTSGSTGRPKGVMVSQGALARYVEAVRQVYGICPGDRVLQFCSTSFDTSLEEIVPCLTGGAELVLRTDAMLGSVATFLESCAAQGVTVLSLPTAYWHEIAAKVETEGLSLPPDLRLIILGGERALLTRVAAWRRFAPERPRLLNTYGVTESTIVSTATDLAAPSPAEARGEVSIGRAIGETEILLLDQEGFPVPLGTAGELLLGGALLARGYLGRPDLTAERFVPHPFATEPGARLYRTGDLARSLPDGQLEYAGRADRQIKVRGYRIEVEEIEARLLRHPEVEATVVVVREDTPGEKLIAAYFVPRSFPGPAPAALRAFLRETLPDSMTPSAYVPLAALPLTPNGKLDRGALPAPASALAADESLAAPSDPVEELLAGIWSEVLGLDLGKRVGVRDDFFALGGHSLLATQVVSRVRGVLGAEVSLRQLFEAPTVAELARVVRTARQDATQPPIERVARDRDLPLSFAQQRLWLIDQLEPGSPAYNIPSAVHLSGEVSPARLERIFAEIVRRHEALRTTFAARDGRPAQVIAEPAPLSLPLVDLTGLPEEDREARARALAAEEARRPFDLQRGPLLRLALLRLAAREHVLLVTMHHIVSDGWSMGVLLREIAALAAESPLPDLPVQYADFAVWQRGWLQGEVLEAQLASWKRRLAGAPHVLELPTDRTRPAVQTTRGAVRPIDLPPDLSAALRKLCREEGATPFMALLAAWSVLLGRHAGQEDVLVGCPIAGRNRREIEELIGFFVNTLVLRADLSGNPSFRDLLGRVRIEALEAFSHQDLPFERLVEELVPERDLSHSPLFQVLFVLQTAPAGELSVPGLSLAPLAVDSGVAKLDLTLTLGEALSGALEFNTDLFDASTAERLLARFAALLEAAAGAPGLPLNDLPLLLPAECLQLLEWNDTGAAPMTGLCLHELFATQAERTPDAVALVHETGRLTYRQLARRAGGLARRLRELGVGPETRVAVCLERTPDLIAALLAVLAAGGAYVPIDPNYPAERQELMLDDSGAAVLITRKKVPPLPRGSECVWERGLGGEGPRRLIDLDTLDLPDAPLPHDSGVTPNHLAYLIYTSGSTGRPKGVAIEHRSAVALAGWSRETFSDEELAGVVAATSVCFDLSVFEIFVPLAFGGTILLAANALALPELPAPYDGKFQARLLNTVPSAATELVRSGSLPASVRTVCLAGEPLPAALAAQLYATGTVERVLNLYGPSEDTTYSTGALVPRAPERAPAIGRPIRGTRAHVVDRRGALAPPGVAGELWLAGDGLARGYLGRPELTAERFTPDPFGEAGDRVYRTGDLVRFRPNGDLEFLGRIDHQVKVRGFRIELGEIEAVLRSHPAVRDGVVLARENRLVAWVVLDPTDPTDPTDPRSALAAWLRRRLPDYMVPAAFVLLDALPLSPNGKIDRKALPDPQRSQAPSAGPSDPVEELVAGIWAEVLGLDRVGVHESFFSLGGHSLLATQVVSRLRGALGVELPLRQLFETPTVADLARALRTAGGGRAAPPLVPMPREQDLPLSFAQQRLWLLD
ncbi:MAG TPA: amino acid adenylation domain-containing protein, partial [Thermoanaerobaculia bacterium]|nr:amino acid adenylation domain-containing protein [Thermoanaerobaculia bacterium]